MDDRQVHVPPGPARTRDHPRFIGQPTRAPRGVRLRMVRWFVSDVAGLALVVGRILAVVLVAISIVGAGVTACILYEAAACEDRAEHLGVKHRYTLPAGCLVQMADGAYIPIGNYLSPAGGS